MQAGEGNYVQVESGATGKESISASPLVAGAYGFLWLIVLLFVLRAMKRGAALERDIAALKTRLGGASSDGQPGPAT